MWNLPVQFFCQVTMINLGSLIAFLGVLALSSAATDRVVCYHGSWAVYRPGNGKFNIEDIDPTLCDYLIYTFVGIDGTDGSIKVLDSWYDVDLGAMARFNALKELTPRVKTGVAIGGWNEGSEKYSDVVAHPEKRKKFIGDAVSFLQTYGFDGFDLDWEYPGLRGGDESDKEHFSLLLQEFREEFDKHGYLLTAAVAATGSNVDIAYDVPSLSKYLDYIHVMSYDLHGSWDGVTGHNSPLYASSVDVTEAQKLLNVEASIQTWISKGADPAKIILGIGEYGRSFTLANANEHGLGATAWNGGTAGPYTREAGILGYNEICEMQMEGGWTEVWDDEQKVPYAYKGNQWVGYDTPYSAQLKVEFAKNNNLAGVMVWSVETDDFLGICGEKYPILNAINYALGNSPGTTVSTSSVATTSTTAAPITTTTGGTTSSPPENSDNDCKAEGYFADPEDCNKYYYCEFVSDGYIQFPFHCGDELCFDPELHICTYPPDTK